MQYTPQLSHFELVEAIAHRLRDLPTRSLEKLWPEVERRAKANRAAIAKRLAEKREQRHREDPNIRWALPGIIATLIPYEVMTLVMFDSEMLQFKLPENCPCEGLGEAGSTIKARRLELSWGRCRRGTTPVREILGKWVICCCRTKPWAKKWSFEERYDGTPWAYFPAIFRKFGTKYSTLTAWGERPHALRTYEMVELPPTWLFEPAANDVAGFEAAMGKIGMTEEGGGR